MPVPGFIFAREKTPSSFKSLPFFQPPLRIGRIYKFAALQVCYCSHGIGPIVRNNSTGLDNAVDQDFDHSRVAEAVVQREPDLVPCEPAKTFLIRSRAD